MKNTYFLVGILVIVAIQFIRPEKNISPKSIDDYTNNTSFVPNNIRPILQKACFDCHSNQTAYPWYSNIQPVGWWLQHHVNEGKEHLNFSAFESYSPRKKNKLFEEIIETIKEEEMPLKSYTLIHREAILSENENQLIQKWIDSLRASHVKSNPTAAAVENDQQFEGFNLPLFMQLLLFNE